MLMPPADVLALAERCAPSVAASTLLSIAKVESGLNPLAIGVNGTPRVTVKAATIGEAVRQAEGQIAAGRNVDLGLAQINSRNLAPLGLTVEGAFDPCKNLSASARVLQNGYVRSAPQRVGAQPALLRALSFYNTGHPQRGFDNGYVAKVGAAAAGLKSDLQAPPAPIPPPPRAQWDVFGQVSAVSFLIRPSPPAGEAP